MASVSTNAGQGEEPSGDSSSWKIELEVPRGGAVEAGEDGQASKVVVKLLCGWGVTDMKDRGAEPRSHCHHREKADVVQGQLEVRLLSGGQLVHSFGDTVVPDVVGHKVEQRENHQGNFLDAKHTGKRPLAVELQHLFVPQDSLFGNNLLALIVAIGRAVPLEQLHVPGDFTVGKPPLGLVSLEVKIFFLEDLSVFLLHKMVWVLETCDMFTLIHTVLEIVKVITRRSQG